MFNMRVVYFLVDAFLIFVCLYLFLNILRFLFFKNIQGGGFFGLSDSWIKNEKSSDPQKETKTDDKKENK